MNSYRYPHEYLILFLTFVVVFLVVALTAAATVCTSTVFIALALALAYSSSRQHHQALLAGAYPVTPQSAPELDALVETCLRRLRPGPFQVFVTRSQVLNAYTFGLESPKAVVLYSALFDVMDADELRFILGHELGHVALGHTWLNSLVGGLAGIPSSSSASTLLTLVFLWWNRTCELSADRAGLLACGRVDKAISALVKLVAGPEARSMADLEQAYRQIDAEDDTFLGGLGETLATHPMLIRRIQELRRYAASGAYRRLSERAIAVD
jgi:Zn-dependent protease with chaperone function